MTTQLFGGGSGTVILSYNGASESLCFAPGEDKPLAESTSLLPELLIKGVGSVV